MIIRITALLVIMLCLGLGIFMVGVSLPQGYNRPAIETVIVSVRGCDIIQQVQGDKLITAFAAPDQPKTCKIQKQPK
jgi:hypothetical protein